MYAVRFGIFCLCVLLISSTYAQVEFSNLTFEKACKQAAKANKVVMVVMESSKCGQCNEVANRGLGHASAYAINAMAVSLLATVQSSLWEQMAKYYTSEGGFGVLYFNAEGELIHRWDKSTSSANDYIALSTLAYKKRNVRAVDISRLEHQVKEDPTNSVAVLQLFEARIEMRIKVSQMADEYARATTPAWKDSAEIIRTLIKLQPILGTYADSMMRYQSSSLFFKFWYELPYNVRAETNRKIIVATGMKAIEEKDEKLAQRNARFSASIRENTTPFERSKTMQTVMAGYYKNVKDTNSYVYAIDRIMVQYYLRLNADSLRKVDDETAANAFSGRSNFRRDSMMENGRVGAEFIYSPQAQFIAIAIKNYCWDLYKMKPNSKWVTKASGWAAYGLTIYKSPDLFDTYARLLYMEGKTVAAIEAEEKAVSIMKESQHPSTKFVKVLEAMKAGRPVFDLE